jgi:hypothetical protein
MTKKAEKILNAFRDPSLSEWREPEEEKDLRLAKQKDQLKRELKDLFQEVSDKLDQYYMTEECLSGDKFLNPDKPFLVRALLLSVLQDRTLGSPGFSPEP